MFPPYALAASLLTAVARASAPLARGCLLRVAGSDALYLTFDDGPHPATTPALLHVLAEHQAGATFFVGGQQVRQHPALVRAIARAGHTLGQHGDAHMDPWRHPAQTIEADLERATAALEDVTGEPVRWLRPPYGRITPGVVRWAAAAGQRIALWDIMPGDFLRTARPAAVAHHVRRRARPGSIVVLHEGARLARVAPEATDRLLRCAAVGQRWRRL